MLRSHDNSPGVHGVSPDEKREGYMGNICGKGKF